MDDGTDGETAEPNTDSAQRDKLDRAKLFLSEGFMIAAASACAYLLAFNYEKGYAQHFSIPVQLINVSLATILLFIALALGFLALSVVYLSPFLTMLGHPRRRYFFIIALYAVVPIYLYGPSDWRRWLPLASVFLGGVVLFGLIDYGVPLLAHKKAGDFQARYEAQAALDRAHPSFAVALHRWLGFDAYFLFASLIAFSFIASTAGEAEALQQKTFYVTNTTPELVVLRIYGDTVIAAPFDRASKEVHKSFRILKVSDDAGLALTLEEVGPLKLVPAPTPVPAKNETSTSPPSPSATPVPDESPQARP
jgi:hypothetical protein